MLVEDTTAFIEQLAIVADDGRARKRRRRRAAAELDALRAEWERRIAFEALVKMEQELASMPHVSDLTPGRRLLETRRRRQLGHRVEAMRRRVRTMEREALAARERLRAIERPGRRELPTARAKLFRFHSAQHHLECSERRFAQFAGSQSEQPVLVGRREGRAWWWFLDRFWWDEDGLRAREVKAKVLDADLRRREAAEAIAEARATLFREERSGALEEPASPIVRFGVWCRDRGRCVDCGSAENVGFQAILPPERGGRTTVSNVELRCEGCRERRSLNQERARIGRARVGAAFDLL